VHQHSLELLQHPLDSNNLVEINFESLIPHHATNSSKFTWHNICKHTDTDDVTHTLGEVYFTDVSVYVLGKY